MALLGIICLLYGRFVEPFWLQVKHISISSERIHPGMSLRIVHFSDLHSGAWPPLEDRIAALIAAQKPDLIVFTGDAVVKPRGVPLAQSLFAELSTTAPLYAVPGNQDYRFRDEVFGLNGLHTLERQVAELELNGNRGSLVGASWFSVVESRVQRDHADLRSPARRRTNPTHGERFDRVCVKTALVRRAVTAERGVPLSFPRSQCSSNPRQLPKGRNRSFG